MHYEIFSGCGHQESVSQKSNAQRSDHVTQIPHHNADQNNLELNAWGGSGGGGGDHSWISLVHICLSLCFMFL